VRFILIKRKKDEATLKQSQEENFTNTHKTKFDLINFSYEKLFQIEGKIGTIEEDLGKLKHDMYVLRRTIEFLRAGKDETFDLIDLDE